MWRSSVRRSNARWRASRQSLNRAPPLCSSLASFVAAAAAAMTTMAVMVPAMTAMARVATSLSFRPSYRFCHPYCPSSHPLCLSLRELALVAEAAVLAQESSLHRVLARHHLYQCPLSSRCHLVHQSLSLLVVLFFLAPTLLKRLSTAAMPRTVRLSLIKARYQS